MDSFDPELITVVMPCYNAAAYVTEAVESVLNQTYPHVELVVVDDGSTDGSTEILQNFAAQHPARIALNYQNRLGPYASRNAALVHAHGNYIAFLDADDTWEPGALQQMHAALIAQAGDIAYCGWTTIGTSAIDTHPKLAPDFDADEAIMAFFEHNSWPINSVLVRRNLIDAARGFSERSPTAMDYDLWLRLLATGPQLVRVPEVLAHYRRYPRGATHIPHWRQVFDSVGVREYFSRHHPECLEGVPPARLDALLYDPLLREAYRCHWRNDTESARRLFRRAFRKADWDVADLKHLVASLLPAPIYKQLVNVVTRRRSADIPG